MKISACLVINNEENYLGRCLESIKGLVDEIIVVHDGECKDRSLTIAKKYGAYIYIRPFVGEAEYHRPFSYKKAKGEWILQIDADEFLQRGAKEKIFKLIEDKKTDAYSLWWPYFDGKNYLKKGPFSETYKLCLLRKSKMYMLGISHEYPRTYGRLVKLSDVKLEHSFNYDKYCEEEYGNKWIKWAKIQANQIYNLESAPTFNISPLTKNSVYRNYQFIRKLPIISGILETLKYVLIFLRRGILWSGHDTLKIAWFELRYIWTVRIYLLDLHHGRQL